MDKTDRVLKMLKPQVTAPVNTNVNLPNYSVVAGAEQIKAKTQSLTVGDNSTGTTAQVPNVIFGTAAVGTLTASNYPLGTIYIQYTA